MEQDIRPGEMDGRAQQVPGVSYIEQLQKVQLLTILLREKVSNPSYMEPILARWYALEKNFQDHGYRYDFLEHEVDGEATGWLMGKGVHSQTGEHQVAIYAYGGAAERWERAKGGVVGVFFNRGLNSHRVPVNETVQIPEAVWQRAAILL